MAIVIISLLTFTGLAISAERDCKNPKKTSEKLLCKILKVLPTGDKFILLSLEYPTCIDLIGDEDIS